MAGSKLLSYWPEMSAAIMFCWPLIASRVVFSSVKWKKFHLSDLSVSWCLWSMVVMGNDSAFISNHFSVQVKWIVNLEVIYTVRECFAQERCICSSKRSSTSPSYSQQTKAVCTSNLFPYLHTHVHRVELWPSNADIMLCRQTLNFFYGVMQKTWIWKNGTSGSSSWSSVIRSLMIGQVMFYFT